MVRWAMGVSLLEHHRNEEMLEEVISVVHEQEKVGIIQKRWNRKHQSSSRNEDGGHAP